MKRLSRPHFGKWRQFRDLYEAQALAPMTVNERLDALGIIGAYAAAESRGDADEARRLLRRARIDEGAIEALVQRLRGGEAG